jgi:hypothetical protein
MKTMNICSLARTIRSKNAGSFMITLEIIFADRRIYERVKESGAVTQKAIADAYGLPEDNILDFMFFDPGMGIKANIKRKIPSGGPGETDVYGCQQYAPLFSLEVPWED